MKEFILLIASIVLLVISAVLLVLDQAEWAYVFMCLTFWIYFSANMWHEDE